jgi:hypothetical protein
MAAKLSISQAWEETKAILGKDGRLFASLALAMVVLPAAITGVLNPRGMAPTATPLWADLIMLVATLVALAGQLALIRLALGPSVTVGGAISHGLRRMPIYLLAAILLGCAMILAGIPFVAILVAAGVPIDEFGLIRSPLFLLLCLFYLVLLTFVMVRMLMSSPAAAAEPIGPIAVIKRSWVLTAGHGWRLFGFLVLFFIGALAVVLAVGAATGAVVAAFLGRIEPMTASALVMALIQALIQAAATVMLAVMLARIYVQLAGQSPAQVSVPISGT